MAGLNLSLHAKQTIAYESVATEILYGGAAGGGKALCVNTPIPTPSGWTAMGDLAVGDSVFDENGKPCKIVAATLHMTGRPCYRVTFSDGQSIIADEQHQWLTYTSADLAAIRRRDDDFRAKRRASRPSRGTGKRPDLAARNSSSAKAYGSPVTGSVVTTLEMASRLMAGKRSNQFVPVAGALALPSASLPIDPYVFGLWLGDGTRGQGAITTADQQCIDNIQARGYVCRKRSSKYGWGILGLQSKLKELGVIDSKDIPVEYMRASEGQRMELLRGLMDSDGCANKSGSSEFTNCQESLAIAVHELCSSLGIKATMRKGRAKLIGNDCGPKWTVKFTTSKRVFNLDRKTCRLPGSERGTQKWRAVVSVEAIESVPVRCIQVDSESHLFLAGRGMIPTHNSHLFRVASIMWCATIPGLQVYLFRRLFDDLYKNHMEGPTSFPALLGEWIDAGHVKINYSKNFIEFWNGAKIHLCHLQHEKDVIKYQGAEIHVLLMDELTHFSSSMYRYLRGRLRLGGLAVPPAMKGLFPRILCGSNPGGPGHNWVKAGFVDNAPPLTVVQMDKKEGGLKRQYIPARLDDNPTLTENDPDYADRLEGLGNAALIKAMLSGDWNIVAGGALDDVWSERVIVPAFNVPHSWTVDRSFDWGSTHPFSVCWWAEADGTEATLPNGDKFCPPRGSIILCGEWYGAKAPNEGLKMAPREVAQGIKDRETAMRQSGHISRNVMPGPADNQISAVSQPGTPTIADEMASVGIRWGKSDKAPGTRKIGLELLRSRVKEAGKEYPERPAIYFMDHCRSAIAQLPVLPRDPKNPDDVDTSAEDHAYDAIRYRVLAGKKFDPIAAVRG